LVRLHSHEAVEEAGNLKRAGDLLGDTPLSTYFKASQARDEGFARSSKVKGAGAAAERRRGPVSKGTGTPPTRSTGCFT
jgi:hypothetical protein